MNISLTPELEAYVQEKVTSGFYSSASEVVWESLRLMHTYEYLQKQRINQLNSAIEEGLLQLKTGEKTSAAESYRRLKKKITKVAKNAE